VRKTNGQIEEKIWENVNFFCSSCCTEELCSNIPAMAVLFKTGSSLTKQFYTTQISNLKTQKLESLKEIEELFVFFFFLYKPILLLCPFKFYILLVSISIAYLRGVANETENYFHSFSSSRRQLLFPSFATHMRA
jgi:hypothetical protein